MITAIVMAAWDLEADDGGFTRDGATGQWEWGVPTTGPGGTERVWATQLGGNYLHDAEEALEVPLPDLSGASEPVLVLDHWYDVVPGEVAIVEIETATGWARAEPVYGYPDANGFTGASSGWVRDSFDLSTLAPGGHARLLFRSDLLFARAGWYVREVTVYDGDATPPRLFATSVPSDTQDLDGPYVIEIGAQDDVGVTAITVHATSDEGAPIEASAVDGGAGLWVAELPGQLPGTTLSWWAEGTDGENVARWPAVGESSFRVYLAAPTGLRGPSGRIVGTDVTLAWEAPVSPEAVLGYRVVEQGREDAPIEVDGTAADVPLLPGGSHVWTVAARYSTGLGDESEPVSLDAEASALAALEPASAWPGDHLRVTVEGTSLYLLDGVTTADLGEGVAIEEIRVVDANTAVLLLSVDEAAPPGPRDLSLSGAFGPYVFDEVFAVDDAAGRPRIVAITPETLPQGYRGPLRIEASEPFAGPVSMDLPGAVVAEGDPETGGEIVEIDVVVSGVAAIGTHTAILDDGERLWTVGIPIEERLVETKRCATSPGSGWAGLLALLTVRARRSARRGGGPAR
jgi:hypothetical protein